MTNNEAILILIKMMPQPQRGDGKPTTHVMMTEALTMAIQALNQESVLDKIRTEIKAMFPPSGNWMYDEECEYEHTVCEVLSDVLQILDKYKAESEGRHD